MGDSVTPMPRGNLRPLRREATLTTATTNEQPSAPAVHNLLQELHDDSAESISEHQAPPKDVKRPMPRKGTFGMVSPDSQRATPSPPAATARATSSAVHTIRDDDVADSDAVAGTRDSTEGSERISSGLYGHHSKDEAEDETHQPKMQEARRDGEPGSKRRIRFEEQTTSGTGDAGVEAAGSIGGQQQEVKDSGNQEGAGKSAQKVKQRFRLRFGGKRQQVDTQEPQQQTPEGADEGGQAHKDEQDPREGVDETEKTGKVEDDEKPSDQVGVTSRKSRFALPRLGRNRGKLLEKTPNKEGAPPREQENVEAITQEAEERAEEKEEPGPIEGKDDGSKGVSEVAGKRRGLGFIPRFRGGKNPAPQESTANDPGEPRDAAKDDELPAPLDKEDDQSKAAEVEGTDTTRRRSFGAPWRRWKNAPDVQADEERNVQPTTPTQGDNAVDQDGEDEEVEHITGSGQTDSEGQLRDSKEAAPEDEVRGQRPWSRFRFGNRRQQPQEQQVKDQDDTRTSQNVAPAGGQPMGPDAQLLTVEQQSVSDAVQRAKSMAEQDRQQQQQGHKQQQHQQIQQGRTPMVALPSSHAATGPPTAGVQLSGDGSETRVQVEQDVMPERAVPEEPEDDDKVFVSRLFVDRFVTRRQNAPLPSPPPRSASTVRSVASKPSAPSELYGSCLSRAGRTAQGLLGGLCLFFLLLLLAADDDEVKRIFGASGGASAGGQAQLLQMVIYFLVIVSVITSFDGLNYQQMIAERRPNRFVFTSMVYPAMLILGLTVTKLDNKLAYGGGVTSEEWARWKGVNLGRCACGLIAWIVLCL